ncbi:cardiolipin synthase [Konateibacter massiliensis]|uniref:cardiolipin synthase n=1 Tax=Konateibacter massiliensis TaxID=2002841 RepID=UPI000C15FED9|nr:cardiolipin synthase [Konateibacter massiliensis]
MRTEEKTNVKNSVGRLVFAALSILLQIGWIVLIVFRLNAYSTIISTFISLLAVLIALRIYGRHTNAAFKMPFIIFILGFPVFGLCMYFIFGYSFSAKHIAKHYEKINEELNSDTAQSSRILERLEEADMHLANQSCYIWSYGKYPLYQNTDVEYYKDALDGLNAQIEELEKAQQFIFMEYHAIEESSSFLRLKEVLAKKAREGVEVRVFYDDIGSIGFINRDFVGRMEKEGIQCRVFNPVVPFFHVFLNNRDHRKITVIDGKVGFTGGYNLADEYFNVTHPYGHWKDTGIKLTGDAVKSLTIMFLEMWNSMKKTDIDYSQYLCNFDYTAKEQGYIQPYADSPLDDEYMGENVYLNLIQSATRKLYITTPYLIISDEMSRELGLAAKRGVDVRIITPGIPDKKLIYQVTRSYYAGLARNGVRIYEYTPGFLHSKQFLSDDETAVVGTINLDYRSLYHHFENAVLFHGYQAISDVKEDFEETFAVSAEVTEKYQDKRFAMLRIGQCILRLFAPLL